MPGTCSAQNSPQGIFEIRVTKDVAARKKLRGLDALAGEQEPVGHFSEHEASQKAGNGRHWAGKVRGPGFW